VMFIVVSHFLGLGGFHLLFFLFNSLESRLSETLAEVGNEGFLLVFVGHHLFCHGLVLHEVANKVI